MWEIPLIRTLTFTRGNYKITTMELPGGWCSCIIYTVIYISTTKFVHCNTTTIESSPSSAYENEISTFSKSTTTSILSDFITTASSTDNPTQASETLSMSVSASSPSLQSSSIDTYSLSLLTDVTKTTINDSVPSMTQSQSMSSPVSTSTSPPVLSSMSLSVLSSVLLSFSPSVSPSQTVVESSATVNSSSSNELESTTSIQASSPTLSLSQEILNDTSTIVISTSGSSSGGMLLTSMMTSSFTSEIETEIVSSSMHNGNFVSSSTYDMSSPTSSPDYLPQETASESLSSSPSPTGMLTSSSTQSSDLSSIVSSDTSSVVTMSETSDIASQVTSTGTIQPTLSTAATVPSSVITQTTTQPTTTTTTTPATSTLSQTIEVEVDSSSLYKVPATLEISNCSHFATPKELRTSIMDILINVTAVRNVEIISSTCSRLRVKRSTTDTGSADIHIIAAKQENPSDFAIRVNDTFAIDEFIYLKDTQKFIDGVNEVFWNPCKSDICDKYFGYTCRKKSNTTASCDSLCTGNTCTNNGHCKIIVNETNVFGTKCICKSEEYYKYEGEKCENKRMKWELAVAIAGGAAGGIILILVVALILCCCCKSKDDQYKYRRDSYEPMSEIVGKPAYYRNDGPKTHQTGFSNFGYEDDYRGNPPLTNDEPSWNPEESKDTYAKISEQLGNENSFQIKRPQVAGSRQSTVNEDNIEGEDRVLTMSHRL